MEAEHKENIIQLQEPTGSESETTPAEALLSESIKSESLQNRQARWVSGITATDKDSETAPTNFVKSFTGYSLQFKTWNRSDSQKTVVENSNKSDSDSDFEVVAISNPNPNFLEETSSQKGFEPSDINNSDEKINSLYKEKSSLSETSDLRKEVGLSRSHIDSINKGEQPNKMGKLKNLQNSELLVKPNSSVSLAQQDSIKEVGEIKNAEDENSKTDILRDSSAVSLNGVIEHTDNINVIDLSESDDLESLDVIEIPTESYEKKSTANSNISASNQQTLNSSNSQKFLDIDRTLRERVHRRIKIALENTETTNENPAKVSTDLVNDLQQAKTKYGAVIKDYHNKKMNLLSTKKVLEIKMERKIAVNDSLGVSFIQQKLHALIEQIRIMSEAISPITSLFMFYDTMIKEYENKIKQINLQRHSALIPGNFFDKAKEQGVYENKSSDHLIRRHINKLYSGIETPFTEEPSFGSQVITKTADTYDIPSQSLKPTKTESITLLFSLDLENNGYNIDVMNYKKKLVAKANAELKMQTAVRQRPEIKDNIEDEESTLDLDMEKILEPHFLPDPVLKHLIELFFNKQGMDVPFSELSREYTENVQENNVLTLLFAEPVAVPKFLILDDKKKYPYDFNDLKIFLEALSNLFLSKDVKIVSKMFFMFKIIGGLLIRCRYASYVNYINCQDLLKQYKTSEINLKSSKSYDLNTKSFKSIQVQNQFLLLQRKIHSIQKYNVLYNFIINKIHFYEIKLRTLGFPQIPDVTTIVQYLQLYRKQTIESKMTCNDKDAIKSARSLLKIDDDSTAAGRNITADDLNQLEKLIDEIKTATAEDELDTPPEMACTLMKHQKIGLFRLNHLENSSSKGGILGDEMGLGKTIQIIALMLLNKQIISNEKSENEDFEKADGKAPTLIIAPVSLLHNWNFEIENKIKKEFSLSVTVFHESNKPSKFEDFKKFDVILTSYGTLYSEYRKHLPSSIDKTQSSYIDFAGESRKLPPMPSLSFFAKLKKSNEYVSPFFQENSTFYRIILDEAHEIKNTATGKSKACCLLSSEYRWCLTGTPVQNNVYDMYALLKFLRIRPYMKEVVFKEKIGRFLDLKKNKATPSSSVESRRSAERHLQALVARISLRRTKETKIDGNPILALPELNDFKVDAQMEGEERSIYSQLEANIAEEARMVLKNPRSPMAKKRPIFTLLLRLRQACIHYVLVKIGEIKSEIRELNDYEYEKEWGTFKRYIINQSAVTSTEVNMFLEGKTACGVCKQFKNSSQIEFQQALYNPNCGHCICDDCFTGHCQDNFIVDEDTRDVLITCPVCTSTIQQSDWIPTKLFDFIVNEGITNDFELMQKFETHIENLVQYKEKDAILNMEDLPVSCKIQQTIDVIKKIRTSEPDAKILIFCSFTYFFKILSHFVKSQLDIGFTQFDGTLNVHQKSAAIEEFRKNPDCGLMFISLKAGNVGLTLTMANHVILIDPYWNPSVEDQAIGRSHRISQNKSVQVHRLLIKNTVEDRILTIQQRKKALAGSILDSENLKDIASLGRRELGYLFGLNDLDDRRVTNDNIGEPMDIE
ncbi:hypothetical protein QEN19_000265 [Hanseniaspora menglaensis]